MLLNLFIGITGTPHSPILFGPIPITIRDVLHPAPQESKVGTKGHKEGLNRCQELINSFTNVGVQPKTPLH